MTAKEWAVKRAEEERQFAETQRDDDDQPDYVWYLRFAHWKPEPKKEDKDAVQRST